MTVHGLIEFTIIERSEERVIAEMLIITGIKNPFGVAHAGAIVWFADVTGTVLIIRKAEHLNGRRGQCPRTLA